YRTLTAPTYTLFPSTTLFRSTRCALTARRTRTRVEHRTLVDHCSRAPVAANVRAHDELRTLGCHFPCPNLADLSRMVVPSLSSRRRSRSCKCFLVARKSCRDSCCGVDLWFDLVSR